jgi:hypothetical protein
MWENLFRNIYAGVGAFHTMLMFDSLNFRGRNRLVLIEPSKPKKFVDDILQAVTPYPVKWYGELEDGLYRSATLGISRDFGISEIRVEMVSSIISSPFFSFSFLIVHMMCSSLNTPNEFYGEILHSSFSAILLKLGSWNNVEHE